ncbi:MAG TPA: CBS domain-containing protein [Planctomycetota bacterium]|nr:CBS domain-containing protein [Planctomycetota bacterium]
MPARSEFEEQYDAAVAGEEKEIQGALVGNPVSLLEPAQPILVTRGTTVRDAIGKMKEARQGAVCIVDDAGKLAGIFSERDVLTRVVGMDLDVHKTAVGQVMTANPESLRPTAKIAYALNRMSVGGFRNLPIVDETGKPIGIVFTRHFVKFIVSLFPEATLNLPQTDALKNPNMISGG